jgi:hypothetical protein
MLVYSGIYEKESAMSIFTAFRDFLEGFARGLGLYFTERNDHLARAVTPGFRPKSRS